MLTGILASLLDVGGVEKAPVIANRIAAKGKIAVSIFMSLDLLIVR
jgi:hypothetical protein